MEFSEQYKHPKWQMRRLDYIRTVTEFYELTTPICEFCQSDNKQLHVHHLAYEKGKMIWEYPDDDLILLCDDCHKEWHEKHTRIKKSIKRIESKSEKIYDFDKICEILAKVDIVQFGIIADIIIESYGLVDFIDYIDLKNRQ